MNPGMNSNRPFSTFRSPIKTLSLISLFFFLLFALVGLMVWNLHSRYLHTESREKQILEFVAEVVQINEALTLSGVAAAHGDNIRLGQEQEIDRNRLHQIIEKQLATASPEGKPLLQKMLEINQVLKELEKQSLDLAARGRFQEAQKAHSSRQYMQLNYEFLQFLSRFSKRAKEGVEMDFHQFFRGIFNFSVIGSSLLLFLWVLTLVLVRRSYQRETLAEGQLEESEERFQSLAGVSPVGIFQTDGQGECIYVNRKWCEIAGINESHAWGRGWVQTLHPEDRQRVFEKWQSSLEHLTRFDDQYRFRKPDGTITWVAGCAIPRVSAEGQPAGYVGTITDITELKTLIENFSESEQLIGHISHVQEQYIEDADPRTIFEELLDKFLEIAQSEYGFIGETLHDDAGQPYLKIYSIKAITPQSEFTRFFEGHYPPGGEFRAIDTLFGLVLKTNREVISNDVAGDPRHKALPEGHPPLKSFLGLPLIQGAVQVGIVGLANRPQGYSRELLARLAPLLHTASAIITAYRIDQKRKKAEQALKRSHDNLESLVLDRTRDLAASEAKFRSVVNQAADGIFLHDLEGRYVDVNNTACETLGYARKEFLKMRVEDVETGVSKETMVQHWTEMEKGKISITHEGVHRRKDGSTFPVEIRLGFASLGGKNLIVAIARDITLRKQNQQKLEWARNEIMASKKLAAIGQLSAGVSHEVLNPLNIISVHTQLLMRKRKDDPALLEPLGKIMNEIKRIQKIMSALLTFSHKGKSEFEPVDVENELEAVLTLVEKDYTLENITIVRRFEGNLPPISGDRDRLRQVYLNLIHNARQAMNRGGTLTLETRKGVEEKETWIQIGFTDTGCGIKKEHLDKMFEPFFTTKPEGQGTGMGLAVVHGIIESHRGTISVQSEENKGSTFSIKIPV